VPEIAEEIHLSPTTVRTHVQHIYQKLGVHGRIEALQKAEDLGIL
jgi:two-component system nitrate/nitrite response regulator NarL